jgi:hypothetical protein
LRRFVVVGGNWLLEGKPKLCGARIIRRDLCI